jgi:uncharacterized protein YrrD
MTTQAEVVRQSELLHQLVINRDSMEELGRVEVVWMYAPSHRVLGFVCKSGLLNSKKKAFKLSQVTTLGTNGVLTHSQPEETDANKVSKLETVINSEVWSDSGKKVGKITDYIFNLKTGEISKYLLVSSGLGGVTGEIYELFPSQILSIGRRRVLVPEYALTSLSIYRTGIKQKLTKAGEFLKEEKEQVTQELRTLTQRAQETTQQTKGRLWNLTEQLKERAQSLSHEAQEKIHALSDQLKEESYTLVDQAREKSNDWLEQMREQTHTFSEQVEDGIQTLTVQAREILDSDEDGEEAFNQPSSFTDTDDPEDFFDALFKDEAEASPSVPPTPPTPSPGLEVSSPAPAPSDTVTSDPIPPSTNFRAAVDTEDEIDSFFDDLWDDPPTPPTAPIETPGNPVELNPEAPINAPSESVTTESVNSTAVDDDDEFWV